MAACRVQAAGEVGPGANFTIRQSSSRLPGWYPDNYRPGVVRWWDGISWTDHTQPAQPTAPAYPAQGGLPGFTPPAAPAPQPAMPAAQPQFAACETVAVETPASRVTLSSVNGRELPGLAD